MKGFQVTFFTEQGRRRGHTPIHEWLKEVGKSLGITGITTAMGVEGIGRDGKLHSAHFIELADQPIEITMAMTEAQCEALFGRLEQEKSNLFYVKTAVEFGVLGDAASG
jgi:PII-like signaling protein